MKLLDLFSGAGGAAMGYARAGFEIVGVDQRPQPHYPFTFVQGDALDYLEWYGHRFDVIHCSPPCQRYSKLTPMAARGGHPDLIGVLRTELERCGQPYVIENVEGARHLLREPIMLCGTMFGLPIWRHRYFEVWPPLSLLTSDCNHSDAPVLISGTPRRKGQRRQDPPVARKRAAMGIQWMTISELDEAIPPAYTQLIGELLFGQVGLF